MDKEFKLKKLIFLLRIFIVLLSASFSVYGIFRGELKVVFNKAVRICLECMGIA